MQKYEDRIYGSRTQAYQKWHQRLNDDQVWQHTDISVALWERARSMKRILIAHALLISSYLTFARSGVRVSQEKGTKNEKPYEIMAMPFHQKQAKSSRISVWSCLRRFY